MKVFFVVVVFFALLIVTVFFISACGLKNCSVNSLVINPIATATPNCCLSVRTLTGPSGGGTFGSSLPAAAVDNARGRYYVADGINNCIQVIQLNGTSLGTIGGASPTWGTTGEFSDPNALALDANDNLLVGEYSAAQVIKVNPATGAALGNFGSGAVSYVRAVFVDTNGDVYLGTEGGTLYVYQPVSGSPNSYNEVGDFDVSAVVGQTPSGLLKQGSELYITTGSVNIYGAQVTTSPSYSLGTQTVVNSSTIGSYALVQNSQGDIYVTSYFNAQFFVFSPGFASVIYSCVAPLNDLGIGVDNQGYVYLPGSISGGTIGEIVQMTACPL
jgi:hypothetical protein